MKDFLSRLYLNNLLVFGSGALFLTICYLLVFFGVSWSGVMPWACLASLPLVWAIVWKASVRPTK